MAPSPRKKQKGGKSQNKTRPPKNGDSLPPQPKNETDICIDPSELSDSEGDLANCYLNPCKKSIVQTPQSSQRQLLTVPVSPNCEFFPGLSSPHKPRVSDIKPERVPSDPTISGFKCMGGCSHLFEQVRTRILFPIINPDFMKRHGRTPPKGIILHGPPGTGKTLFAKCLAAELSRVKGQPYKFFMGRGPDVLNSLVGESDKNLRSVFASAVENQPSILFFDEIDALCPDRNAHESCSPTVNLVCTLLSEMDKIVNGQVLILAATNRLQSVDPALLRPGRCDISLAFHYPGFEGRKEILQIYTKSWGQSSPSKSLISQLALSTNGFTGADLNKLCSESFFNCVKRTQGEQTSTSNKLFVKEVSGKEKVKPKDWMEALGSMRPSKSNIFGSYVTTLKISEFCQPLIQNICQNLEYEFRGVVPENNFYQFGGPNGFLVWNNWPKCDDIIDSIVVPTVLSRFNSLTVFVLNEETMLQEHSSLTINAINDIIRQAKECEKPSVLFVPRIDILTQRLGEEGPILKRLLFNLGNKTPLTVLATASCSTNDLHENAQPIFEGFKKSFKIQNPDQDSRELFFRPIFKEHAIQVCSPSSSSTDGGLQATKKVLPEDCRQALDELFEDVISVTGQGDLWSMVTLHRELFNLCEEFQECQDKTKLLEKINEIIVQYDKNELDASKKC